MISYQEEGWDSGFGQTDYSLGELPLVSLGRIATPIGVAAEEGEVHTGLDSAVDHLIEGVEKVLEARGQAGSRVGAGVVLDAYVDVGVVEDSHNQLMLMTV